MQRDQLLSARASDWPTCPPRPSLPKILSSGSGRYSNDSFILYGNNNAFHLRYQQELFHLICSNVSAREERTPPCWTTISLTCANGEDKGYSSATLECIMSVFQHKTQPTNLIPLRSLNTNLYSIDIPSIIQRILTGLLNGCL